VKSILVVIVSYELSKANSTISISVYEGLKASDEGRLPSLISASLGCALSLSLTRVLLKHSPKVVGRKKAVMVKIVFLEKLAQAYLLS
jgi:hypothetical protein